MNHFFPADIALACPYSIHSAHLEVSNSYTSFTGLPGIDSTAHCGYRDCVGDLSIFFGVGVVFHVCTS